MRKNLIMIENRDRRNLFEEIIIKNRWVKFY